MERETEKEVEETGGRGRKELAQRMVITGDFAAACVTT